MLAAVSNSKHYAWTDWFVGIMRSFISGAAGAIVGILGPMSTDANDFNITSAAGLHHTLWSMGIGFVFSGVVHMAMYLQTHSAPELVANGHEKPSN